VKAKKSFWKMGYIAAVSLVWLIIRTGGKPSRITYPCQKAAVANVNIFLLALFAPVLAFGKFKTTLPRLDNRVIITALLGGSLLLAFGSVASTFYSPLQSISVPISIDLPTRSAVSPVGSSDLFFVENAYDSQGSLDGAVSTLVQLMATYGLSFFKSASQPSGLIGSNDVVILKVNSEWNQRGQTNNDLVKSIIKKILSHPDGFTGEVVVADNGQWTERTNQSQWYTPSNAYDQSESMYTMITNSFSSGKVSTWLWDIIRHTQVNEYSQGDYRDGYAVSITDPHTGIQVSYPKFKTKYGTYISLMNGVWSGSAYDSSRLKLINIPVLKSHSTYGVSGCIKHYMGVLSNSAGFSDGHSLIGAGAMASIMADVRFPTLNILDCVYVNANPRESGSASVGPATSYVDASYTNKIGASLDPVALDYYASKYILMPAAKAKGYTSYTSMDPDYVSTSWDSFYNYLLNSMKELKNHGFQATMTESQMNVCARARASYGDVQPPWGMIDMKDISYVARRFYCVPGDPLWDPNADFNGDGRINMRDVALPAKNFLVSY
jgi:hypothetical protein